VSSPSFERKAGSNQGCNSLREASQPARFSTDSEIGPSPGQVLQIRQLIRTGSSRHFRADRIVVDVYPETKELKFTQMTDLFSNHVSVRCSSEDTGRFSRKEKQFFTERFAFPSFCQLDQSVCVVFFWSNSVSLTNTESCQVLPAHWIYCCQSERISFWGAVCFSDLLTCFDKCWLDCGVLKKMQAAVPPKRRKLLQIYKAVEPTRLP